jgi:class 3 adenylate cyclase
MAERGALHRLTLRFLDEDLEYRFQHEEGGGASGFRITTLAATVLWAVAALIIPAATTIPRLTAWTSAGLMAVASFIAFYSSRWASTLNRQHLVISILTAGNGLVIIALGVAAGDFRRGYMVGGIMLLYLFGFVARTRMVYALMRTLVIAGGFAYVALTYEGPGSLLLDTFYLGAVSVGSILGLRRLERDRRQVYHQQLVIAEQGTALQQEKDETERLLLNILPATVSRRLRRGESPIADNFSSVSVLFADIVGFTTLAAQMPADEVIDFLSEIFVCYDRLVDERQLEKIKTIGDAYMVAGGLPDPLEGHAARVVDLGLEMLKVVADVSTIPGVTLRVGIHSGPAAGGVIGRRRFAYDVWGDTVNVASRLEEHGVPGRVHISDTTALLVAERFELEPRGTIELRGHGPMATYLVVGPQGEPGA